MILRSDPKIPIARTSSLRSKINWDCIFFRTLHLIDEKETWKYGFAQCFDFDFSSRFWLLKKVKIAEINAEYLSSRFKYLRVNKIHGSIDGINNPSGFLCKIFNESRLSCGVFLSNKIMLRKLFPKWTIEILLLLRSYQFKETTVI